MRKIVLLVMGACVQISLAGAAEFTGDYRPLRARYLIYSGETGGTWSSNGNR